MTNTLKHEDIKVGMMFKDNMGNDWKVETKATLPSSSYTLSNRVGDTSIYDIKNVKHSTINEMTYLEEIQDDFV